jgi:hypothetical protein
MAQCTPENVRDIVQRGETTMLADWRAFPGYASVERDVDVSKGIETVRTYRVFMMEGSDYYMQIAFNDKPYAADQLTQERGKLLQEAQRRSREKRKEKQKRSERYWKERNQAGVLLEQYVRAFDFRLIGEEVINGRSACVLAAKPRPDYRPPNRVARILTGMQGRMWIDKHDFHWLKAEAEVLRPVSNSRSRREGFAGDTHGTRNGSGQSVRVAGEPLRRCSKDLGPLAIHRTCQRDKPERLSAGFRCAGR